MCGIRPVDLGSRIIGGRPAYYGEVPFQVIVKENKIFGLSRQEKCGGVIISSRWILTAAHCQRGWMGSLRVILGRHEKHENGDQDQTMVELPVKRVIVHPDFSYQYLANDIALVELEHPIEFNDNTQPICLPSEYDDFSGEMGTISGWGKINITNGRKPRKLQVAQVPIMNPKDCMEMFMKRGIRRNIYDTMVCAGYSAGGIDSCSGDSGGPLMVERDGLWVLAGIVSHGISCAQRNLPGVYTSVPAYLDWIKLTQYTAQFVE
ncbi:serine protease filzig-like isoform X2 [Brevipalpus obovatus]